VIDDFNNDTQQDIVVVNSRSHNVGILLGFGDETFANQITYFIDHNSILCSVAVGDFNNDARMDIIVADSRLSNVYVLLGYRNGSFENQRTVVIDDMNNLNRIDTGLAEVLLSFLF